MLPVGGSALSHDGLGNVFFDPILLKPIEIFILSSCFNLSLSTCLVVILDTGEEDNDDDDDDDEDEEEDEDEDEEVSIELIFDIVLVCIVVVTFIDSDLREKRLTAGDDTLLPLMVLMIDLTLIISLMVCCWR